MKYDLLVYIILIVNILSFVLFGIDKDRSKRGAWRIPESVLFLSAAFYGSIGTLAGMFLFHHKTKHLKFTIGVPLLFIIQVASIFFVKYILNY